MNATQFLTPALRDDEEEVERSLRPRRLDEFVGQARIKEQLAIVLDAAKGRGEALDHVLLVGPPGLGKTSLAHIIREELGVGIRSVAGPALERKDVAAILTAVEARDVVFVDEIHRLSRAAEEIASRSRGTPRVANRILRRVRDVAEVRHEGAITTAIAREALDLLEVDEAGLERLDRELLRAIVEKYAGGPVGVNTLAASLGEEPDTIEYVYEPYLLQLGFIARTPRGRTITPLGRAHVGSASEPETRLF